MMRRLCLALLVLVSVGDFGRAQSACLAPPAGLIGWWSGESGADDELRANDGSLLGGAALGPGKVGQAFWLDGIDDSVAVPASAALTPQRLTVEAWVYPTGAGAPPDSLGPVIVSKDTVGTPAGAGVSFALLGPNAGGHLTGFVQFTDGTQPAVVGTGTLAYNTWHHVALSWDGASMRLYLDGALDGTTTVGPKTVNYSSNPLGIGRHPVFNARAFAGAIDEVSLYDRALGTSELQAIVAADAAGKCRPAPPPAPTCLAVPDNAVFWLRGNGDATDDLGTVTATLENGAGFGPGLVGQAFALDGVDDDVRVQAGAVLEPQRFSLEAWVNALNAGSTPDALGPVIVTKDTTGTAAGAGVSIGLFGPGTTGRFTAAVHFTDGTQPQVTSAVVASGLWYHVAATWDGNVLSLYVDGALQGVQTVGPKTIAYSAHDLGIGKHTAFSGRAFAGLIDEVTLYRRALTADEVRAIYRAKGAGKCLTPPDTTPPTLEILSPPMPVEATGPDGAVVTFSVTASDDLPGPVDVTCNRPQTDTYAFSAEPLQVTCTATDASGNTATASFLVSVRDTTPPVFAGLPDLSIEAQSASGASVSFTPPQAVDLVSGLVPSTCSTDAGPVFETAGERETFPLGATPVTCAARDGFGNVAAVSFIVSVADTLAPALALDDIYATAVDPAGSVIDFTAVATDLVDGAIDAVCSPTSGTVFPIGTTTVTCNAADAAGNGVTATFDAVVSDGVPPTVAAPADVLVEATSADGAVATFNATATDNIDEVVTPLCEPASGSQFPLGATTVTCTATDAANNAASASFSVTVQDTTPPRMPVHDIVAVLSAGTTTVVTYEVVAFDIVDGSVAVDCTPRSGSSFPLGATTVSCQAVDAAGNDAASSFTVRVNDGAAPVVTVPGDMVLEALSPLGAAGTFVASATDNVDSAVPVVCTPLSGSVFPLGTTQVTCEATDASQNVGSANFRIGVVDTTPPALTLPGSFDASAATAAGVAVEYEATAVDLVDGARPVTCLPASGSTLLPGDTTVNCSTSDGRGNAATGSFVVTVTVVDNRIARFVAFGSEQTWLRSKAVVLSGDVGANAPVGGPQGARDLDDAGERDQTVEVRIGEQVTMRQPGARIVGDTVWLRANALVYDVLSNELINRRATILGTATSPVAQPYLTMPAFPAVTAGTTPVAVAQRSTLTLPAGRYGKVLVGKGATLILTGGVYEMLSLDLDQQATVLVRAASELRIATELDTESRSKVILDQSIAGLNAAQVLIFVAGADADCAHDGIGPDGDNAGKTAVHVGVENVIQANIYAPNGTVWLKARTLATGAFVGRRVRIGEKVELALANGLR